MLKFLFWYYYRDHVYTDEPELFYKFYKWNSGLFTLISLRRIIGTILFCFTGFVWMLINPCIYVIILFYIGAPLLISLEVTIFKKPHFLPKRKSIIKSIRIIEKTISATIIAPNLSLNVTTLSYLTQSSSILTPRFLA